MAILYRGLFLVIGAVGFAAMVKVVAVMGSKTHDTSSGFAARNYVLFTVLAWVAEMQLLRLAGPGMDSRRWLGDSPVNWWSTLTLWWPPEFLRHPAALGAAPLAIVVAALFIGILLNVERLRDASLPIWVAGAAIVPFVNVALFLFLAVTPSRRAELEPPITWKERVLPRDMLGSALVSCVFTAILGLTIAEFGIEHFGVYGWSLFFAGPLIMGFVAAVVYGSAEPRSVDSCVYVAMGSVVLIGLGFLGFALEGMMCILMAAPIALPLAALGGWLGYLVQRRGEQRPQFAGALLLLLPCMMYGEQHAFTQARAIKASTSLVIHAPADRVWEKVIRLASVPKPDSVLFDSVAYPIRTTLEGNGIGATRRCVFSTGSIVEPVEVWEPSQELRFAVVEQPPLMQELSPFGDVHPPHLRLEYLRSREGQFTLSPQPDGSTLLTGTSYYESRLWPGDYWQLWTDSVAHRVHSVVLKEIKRQAEQH